MMILMLRTDDGDFLLVSRFTLVTQADLLGESIIFQLKFVGIILNRLYNVASHFGQSMSNIVVS